MAKREKMFGASDYTPTDSIENLEDGTYYLTKVDKMFKRYYAIKNSDGSATTEGVLSPPLPKEASQRLAALNVHFK